MKAKNYLERPPAQGPHFVKIKSPNT